MRYNPLESREEVMDMEVKRDGGCKPSFEMDEQYVEIAERRIQAALTERAGTMRYWGDLSMCCSTRSMRSNGEEDGQDDQGLYLSPTDRRLCHKPS